MSAVAPLDTFNTTSSVPKKKSNKKKKHAKSKANGETHKSQDNEKELAVEIANDDGEGEESGPSTVNTPKDAHFPENIISQTNGYKNDSSSNGHSLAPTTQSATNDDVKSEGDASDTEDASIRLEAMSAQRQALRVEVEQARKALQQLLPKSMDEISPLEEGRSIESLLLEKRLLIAFEERHREKEAQLEEAVNEKQRWESQYHALLERVNTIKTTLGERLKADRQELAEANEKIDELGTQNESLQNVVQNLQDELSKIRIEQHESSKELSSLRNRHNLSQQNWVNEREDLVQQTRQLKEEADAAKEAMGDWEVLAMEERSIRENLEGRVADMEEQYSATKEAYEAAVTERDSQSQTVDGLQRALQEIQETRRRELREMVESSEAQVQALKKLVQESDSKCAAAEASKEAQKTELDRLLPIEKEVKEKNLLIGKLRHEAIVLNDHLTKALRFLKKAKPEENVDRQIVTNHFLHFLALDRSDPKKFQILQLIASLLNWTEEQKEQAGLARPGTSNNSLRLPMSPFHRTPSTPSLSTEFFTESHSAIKEKESLADLWTGFLERSAEEGSQKDSRSDSITSLPARPDTRSGSKS